MAQKSIIGILNTTIIIVFGYFVAQTHIITTKMKKIRHFSLIIGNYY